MKQIKQISLFCLLWLVEMNASAEIYTGDCGKNGDNVKQSLDTETGVIVILGKGEMKDYYYGSFAPWYYNYRSNIHSVQIEYCSQTKWCKNGWKICKTANKSKDPSNKKDRRS